MVFSIKKSFKDSWNMFSDKKIYWNFITTNFLAIAGLYVAFSLIAVLGVMLLTRGSVVLFVGVILVALFFAVYFLLANVHIPLAVYKTKKVVLRTIFKNAWNIKMIGQTMGLFFLMLLIVGGGAVLFVWLGAKVQPVVGIVLAGIWAGYFAIRWAFALYILVDMKLGTVDSLKKSHTIMKKNGWKFLGFIIIISVISIIIQSVVSGIALASPLVSQVISILFAIFFAPWFSLLSVSPYIQLTHHNHS